MSGPACNRKQHLEHQIIGSLNLSKLSLFENRWRLCHCLFINIAELGMRAQLRLLDEALCCCARSPLPFVDSFICAVLCLADQAAQTCLSGLWPDADTQMKMCHATCPDSALDLSLPITIFVLNQKPLVFIVVLLDSSLRTIRHYDRMAWLISDKSCFDHRYLCQTVISRVHMSMAKWNCHCT